MPFGFRDLGALRSHGGIAPVTKQSGQRRQVLEEARLAPVPGVILTLAGFKSWSGSFRRLKISMSRR
jgi:hypothetical protein